MKPSKVHPPVGGLSQNDLEVSKNRSKLLNQKERLQIEDWIHHQSQKFYPTGMNYWIDIEAIDQRNKKKDGEEVSYQYEIYDFEQVKLYPNPKVVISGTLGKFEEIKAVEDAVRYMKNGEEVTLLVPSVLAYGTYGDGKEISNDMPLIIKLKLTHYKLNSL